MGVPTADQHDIAAHQLFFSHCRIGLPSDFDCANLLGARRGGLRQVPIPRDVRVFSFHMRGTIQSNAHLEQLLVAEDTRRASPSNHQFVEVITGFGPLARPPDISDA
jgi:hypothetical protein